MHEVTTDADKKAFIEFALEIYKNDSNWIRPLDKDIEEVFDPAKNKFIKRGGEYARWLLKDDRGGITGRIASFVNKQYKEAQPTGGIGFLNVSTTRPAPISCLTTARHGCSSGAWRQWMAP